MTNAAQTLSQMTKAILDQLADGEELSEGEAKRVRRGIARINYISQDRPDLSYSARELSRHMAKPKDGTKKALTYVIRYLQGSPRCVEVWAADYNPEDVAIKVLSDADWASDKVTRRSVSGGIVSMGGISLCHWNKTQSTVALSSGESEFNAVLNAIIEALAVANLQEELWDVRPPILLGTDASACKGMLLRVGTCRLKHMSTKQVWAQGAVAAFGIQVHKILRSINSSDVLTHSCNAQEWKDHLFRMGLHIQGSGED